jgi:hypothetical protein
LTCQHIRCPYIIYATSLLFAMFYRTLSHNSIANLQPRGIQTTKNGVRYLIQNQRPCKELHSSLNPSKMPLKQPTRPLYVTSFTENVFFIIHQSTYSSELRIITDVSYCKSSSGAYNPYKHLCRRRGERFPIASMQSHGCTVHLDPALISEGSSCQGLKRFHSLRSSPKSATAPHATVHGAVRPADCLLSPPSPTPCLFCVSDATAFTTPYLGVSNRHHRWSFAVTIYPCRITFLM